MPTDDEDEDVTPPTMPSPYPETVPTRGSRYTVGDSGPVSGILRQYYKAGRNEQNLLDAAIQGLMARRDERDALPLLAMASGFMQPTRAGSFAESAGAGMGAALGPLTAEKERRLALDKQALQLRLARSGIDKEMAKTALGAASKMPTFASGPGDEPPTGGGPVPPVSGEMPPGGTVRPVASADPPGYDSNVGNLLYVAGNKWQGRGDPHTRASGLTYETFENAPAGIAAAYKNLLFHQKEAGGTITFEQLGQKLLGMKPGETNKYGDNPDVWAANVSKMMGRKPTDPVPLNDLPAAVAMVKALAIQEKGPEILRKIPPQAWEAGVRGQLDLKMPPVGGPTPVQGSSGATPPPPVVPAQAGGDSVPSAREGWRQRLNSDGSEYIKNGLRYFARRAPGGGVEYQTVPVKPERPAGGGRPVSILDKTSETGWSTRNPDGSIIKNTPPPSTSDEASKRPKTEIVDMTPDAEIVKKFGVPAQRGRFRVTTDPVSGEITKIQRMGDIVTGEEKKGQPVLTPAEDEEVARAAGLPPMDHDPYAGMSPKARDQAVINDRRAAQKHLDERNKLLDKQTEALRQMDRFLYINEQVKTSGVEGATNKIGAAIPLLGLSPLTREMDAISSDLARQKKQVGEGQISNFDGQQFLKAVPGIDKPYETNKNIGTAYKIAKQMEMDKTAFLNQWVDVRGNMKGAEQAWRRYAEANPIFDRNAKEGSYSLNPDRKTWDEYFRTAGAGGRQRVVVPPEELNKK